MSSFGGSIYLDVLDALSVQKTEVLVVERSNCWLTSYLEYLSDRILPSDRMLARKIKHKSSYFILNDGDLYRRAFFSSLLKYLVPSEAASVLREVNEEIYSDHMGAKTLAYKLLRQGYY